MLKIKSLTGNTTEIEANLDNTITQIKEALEAKTNIPPTQLRLIYNGKSMADEKKLSHYLSEINDDVIIHMVLQLRGG